MSEQLSRRQFLCSAVATVGAAALPATVVASPAIVSPAWEAVPALPAWVVGTAGETDGQIVRATTAEDALRIAIEEMTGDTECRCEEAKAKWSVSCCDYCDYRSRWETWRAEKLDNVENPGPADWIRAGFGHLCERCDYEVQSDTSWIVNEEVVCEDCMGLEDWDIVDPERAAELRADA